MHPPIFRNSLASFILCTLTLPACILAASSCPAPPAPANASPHQFNPVAAKILLSHGIDKILFVRRFTLTANHIYTEHVNSRWTPGGGLCILDLKTGQTYDLLLELNQGVVNRFDISFDGQKVLFDYKKSAREGYRIYEVNVDGTGLHQLTFPAADEADLLKRYHHSTDDMHPCYLPDGGIAFVSTRCRTSILCNNVDDFTTAVLHRMDSDGGNLRQLSNSSVSEASPAILPDGRILYHRWEYNSKGAGAVKAIWAMRPDGTASSEVYGNMIIDPETMIYPRPIPGADDKLVFLGSTHWGPNNAMGTVIVLDMKKDTRSRDAMTFITRDVDARTHGGFHFLVDGKWIHDSTGTPGRLFKDPYPISESLFLVAHKPKGLTWNDPAGYDISLLDEQGQDTLLYRDQQIACWHPYPLRARPMPQVSVAPVDGAIAADNLAHCIVSDVYAGLVGVPRGSVKYLRILEQTPRPWTARNSWPGDHQGMAHTSLGIGILGMKAQHGVVPVEEDGSANFLVPAGRNIYYQLLDENYLAIQTERTIVNYMPGEVRSCVGCHERSQAVSRAASFPKAIRRAPSMPQPQPGDPSPKKIYDYERQIQPIWNQHCVECHNPASTKAITTLDLTAGRTTLYCTSYESLLGLSPGKTRRPRLPLVGSQADENDIRAFVEYTPPYFFGAYSSILAATFGSFEPKFERFGAAAPAMLARVKVLRETHKDVKLPRAEFIRIANWLDASCQYYGSYWGMKNSKYAPSPWFRPDVPFAEAISPQWPPSLLPLYSPAKP